MGKKYLRVTVIINGVFYLIMLLSAALDLKEISWWFHPMFLFSVLIIFDFFGYLFGQKILKNNPKDKYIRLGFIINATAIAALIIYSLFFTGIWD